jgi:periplasmic divalent cation tolerance protein
MRVVLCTCPPADSERIARALVEAGAACVNILPAIRSIYRWKGKVEDDGEALLVIKAAADQVGALEVVMRGVHPYELPEWVVLTPDLSATSAAYQAWVNASGV